MANVEHSVLTGTDLHESKGVAAAAANRVYITNGAGSGTFSQVTDAVLAAAAKPFSGQILHVREDAASGGGTSALTNNAWSTRALSTELSDPGSIGTLASNQITLAAGTYFAMCFASAYCSFTNGTNYLANAKLRLRNVTDSATVLVGNNYRSSFGSLNTSYEANFVLSCVGVFTLAGTKAIELQQYSAASGNSSPTILVRGGFPISSGENEVFADVIIWKTA